jgi:type VI protein secretion system component VasK
MNVSDIRAQRDQALACLVLAVCIALAVFLSVFSERDRIAIDSAKAAVAVHEKLLQESSDNLKTNQDALNSVQAALDALERAHRR